MSSANLLRSQYMACQNWIEALRVRNYQRYLVWTKKQRECTLYIVRVRAVQVRIDCLRSSHPAFFYPIFFFSYSRRVAYRIALRGTVDGCQYSAKVLIFGAEGRGSACTNLVSNSTQERTWATVSFFLAMYPSRMRTKSRINFFLWLLAVDLSLKRRSWVRLLREMAMLF